LRTNADGGPEGPNVVRLEVGGAFDVAGATVLCESRPKGGPTLSQVLSVSCFVMFIVLILFLIRKAPQS
jgi:hypothetical protein